MITQFLLHQVAKQENVLIKLLFLPMSTHQCTASFACEALIKNRMVNHVTLNLTVYWLSVDNLTYPTNHVTRRIMRFTPAWSALSRFGNLLSRRTRKGREILLVSLFALLAYSFFSSRCSILRLSWICKSDVEK